MFYIEPATQPNTLQLMNVDLFKYLHQFFNPKQNSPTIPPKIVGTGIGKRDNDKNLINKTPESLKYDSATNVLRDFAVLVFNYHDDQELTEIKQSWLRFINQLTENPDYLGFVANDQPQYYIVIRLNELLTKTNHRQLIKTIIAQPAFSGIRKLLDANSQKQLTPLPLPAYDAQDERMRYYFQNLPLTNQGLNVKNYITTTTTILQPNSAVQFDVQKLKDTWVHIKTSPLFDHLQTSLEALSDEITDQQLMQKLKSTKDNDEQSPELFLKFSLSLLQAYLDNLINLDFLQLVMRDFTHTNPAMKTKLTKILTQIYYISLHNPAIQKQALPLSTYLPLYRTDHNTSQTMAQQLLNTLGADFMPDPDMPLNVAGNKIKSIYPPALIDRPGRNRDNLVIFNPLTGLWSHDEDLFSSLITAVRPYTSATQQETIISTFAADASMQGRVFKPYSESQYLLFLNGVLDVLTMEFHHLDENFVRDLHFTERSQLHINYVPNPPVPLKQHQRSYDGGVWTPEAFLKAYAGIEMHFDHPDEAPYATNETPLQKAKYQYFLFLLSLGLFGGHNSGVHVSIQGASRWGKSSLAEIYNGLYDNHVIMLSFASLNNQFPFNNYRANTSVIWIKECNVNTAPLNEEHGTIIYDTLADNQARFEIKRQDDFVVINPPQVYVDGTSLVKAQDMSTGPAGRTLVYKLPDMSDTLRSQAYALDISDMLHDEEVLQWIVYQLIVAYNHFIPEQVADPAHATPAEIQKQHNKHLRLAKLRLNLALKQDRQLIPKFAMDWRKDLSSGNDELRDWFKNYIIPYLHDTEDPDSKQASWMHMSVLYELYRQRYDELNPQDSMFEHNIMDHACFVKEITTVIDNSEWSLVYGSYQPGSKNYRSPDYRKQVMDLNDMNFEWNRYGNDNHLPKSYQIHQHKTLPAPFGQRTNGWFRLYHNPHKD